MIWKVRDNMTFWTADGKTPLVGGTVFEASEEEVAHHRDHVEPYKEPKKEEKKPEETQTPRRRGRPPKNRTAFQTPPVDRTM